MRQKSNSTPVTSEKLVRDIRRATRKQYSAEEKIRPVLDGLRGEPPIAELCRREGIVSRSIRCRPQAKPSASMSCHTRRAPYVRSLATKLALTRRPRASSLRDLALGVRFSQAWKPDRETPNALHSHATGQMLRCFAIKTNFMSLPSRRRLRPS